jgi:hypothetical protein
MSCLSASSTEKHHPAAAAAAAAAALLASVMLISMTWVEGRSMIALTEQRQQMPSLANFSGDFV